MQMNIPVLLIYVAIMFITGTRTLIHVRKIATADLWSCPAIQLLVSSVSDYRVSGSITKLADKLHRQITLLRWCSSVTGRCDRESWLYFTVLATSADSKEATPPSFSAPRGLPRSNFAEILNVRKLHMILRCFNLFV